MKLFKNKVGRPSNKTLKKRKIIYLVIILISLLVIGTSVIYTVNYFENSIIGTSKNIKNDEKYYDITKKTVTATFSSKDLDYIEYKSASCTIYNDDDTCVISLPYFNKKGMFNAFWSEIDITSNNLKEKDIKWNPSYFHQVGSKLEISKDTTFYPNYNSAWYDTNSSYSKYRDLNISKTSMYGRTIIEYDKELSENRIAEIDAEFKKIYEEYPWLMVPSKVFYLKEDTFKEVTHLAENVGGITQDMDRRSTGSSYSIITLNDSFYNIKTGIMHEFAHALDFRYKYLTGKTMISETEGFNDYYISIRKKLH